MEIRKLRETVQEKRQKDDTLAAIAKLEANQDYIAMMTDIELESEEDEETAESEDE